MNKNAKLLADFTRYCESHPDERFWQALRNWSGWGFIFVSNDVDMNIEKSADTFYWNGRSGHV